jgi:hypothetical protein
LLRAAAGAKDAGKPRGAATVLCRN